MSNAVKTTVLTHDKATMVFRGGLGYHVIHLRRVTVSAGAYAQFQSALTVVSVGKGKTKPRGIVYTHPDFVLLDGWVDVNLPSAFGDSRREADGTTVTTSIFAGEDAGDIDAAIKAAGATVLRDFRGHDAYAPL